MSSVGKVSIFPLGKSKDHPLSGLCYAPPDMSEEVGNALIKKIMIEWRDAPTRHKDHYKNWISTGNVTFLKGSDGSRDVYFALGTNTAILALLEKIKAGLPESVSTKTIYKDTVDSEGLEAQG